MSRNKRNSIRTRQDGDAPLPLSQQLADALDKTPKETEQPSVETTGEEEIDVGRGLTQPTVTVAEELLLPESAEPDSDSVVANFQSATDQQKAIIWLLKNDLSKASRWLTALTNEPQRLVYDVFQETELEETGVDFSGDEIESATQWAEEQYTTWRETNNLDYEPREYINVPEIWSDDTVTVEPAPDSGASSEAEKSYDSIRARYSLPDHWLDDDVDSWIAAEGYEQVLTDRGNFVVDPTREVRSLEDYATSELLDAIQGLLSNSYGDNEHDIATIYRKREAVDAAWSSRDLIDYLKQGLEPPKVSTGAWKNDITRARRMAQDWTMQELVGWVKGEIFAAGETTDQKIAIELNRRADLNLTSVTPEDVRRVYLKIQSNAVKVVGTPVTAITPDNVQPEPTPVVATATEIPQGLTAMNAAYLKTQTERYAKACAPGRPITMEAGAKEQRELDNLFRYIMKIQDPVGFGNAMAYIRDFFKKNRDGLFDPRYAFRFTGTLRTDGYLQETHINLLNILQVYTDDNKAARKQIDLPFLLSKFPTERQGWLLEFFQKYC